jgi:hypothetical protein
MPDFGDSGASQQSDRFRCGEMRKFGLTASDISHRLGRSLRFVRKWWNVKVDTFSDVKVDIFDDCLLNFS